MKMRKLNYDVLKEFANNRFVPPIVDDDYPLDRVNLLYLFSQHLEKKFLSYEDDNDDTTEFTTLWNRFFTTYRNQYVDMIRALKLEYNPIDNYDRNETTTTETNRTVDERNDSITNVNGARVTTVTNEYGEEHLEVEYSNGEQTVKHNNNVEETIEKLTDATNKIESITENNFDSVVEETETNIGEKTNKTTFNGGERESTTNSMNKPYGYNSEQYSMQSEVDGSVNNNSYTDETINLIGTGTDTTTVSTDGRTDYVNVNNETTISESDNTTQSKSETLTNVIGERSDKQTTQIDEHTTSTKTESDSATDTTTNHYDDVNEDSTTMTTSHIHGNIGVTTTQQMLQSEIELRKLNINKWLVDLFANENLFYC